jgi:hypothetical protein
VRSGYGIVNVECLAACLLLSVICGLVGWLARGAVFQMVTAAGVVVMTTFPVQSSSDFLARLPAWMVAVLLAGVILALTGLMREKFYVAMAVFAWSGLLVDAVLRPAHGVGASTGPRAAPAEHVLWLVLDEHIGLDGFPHSPACASARDHLQHVLARYNFTVFPKAYSNYAATLDSLPSILNDRLLERDGELAPREGTGQLQHYEMPANRLFAEFQSKGYRVSGYQHGAMRFCATSDNVRCREYFDDLGVLHRVPGSWTERFRWLVGNYQSSDPWLYKLKGYFPFRFALRLTGPLALTAIWPNGLAQEVLGEPRKTLFFAHLLTPHSPYLYRPDGSIRPLEEWSSQRPDRRVDRQEYEKIYCRYCEQTDFLAGQLDRLLSDLDRGGALRGMTVVLHGDHGSRIRLQSGTSAHVEGRFALGLYDYDGQPEARDLQDRFSALLAVKPAGAAAPSECLEMHSLLTFLSRSVFGREPSAGVRRADQVYLANERGEMQGIDIQRYWR